MVSGRLLQKLNTTLKEKLNNKRRDFGGISVMALGDPAQLPPIKKTYLFIKGQRGLDAKGHELYMKFTDCNTVILSEIKRTKNSEYKQLQENIRNGIFTDEMIESMNSRFMGSFPESIRSEETHITVASTNKKVKEMYDRCSMALSKSMIRNGDKPPILILADIECYASCIKAKKNTRKRKRSSAIVLTAEEMSELDSLDDKKFDNYPIAFFLYIGAHCMITENLGTQYHLANGTRGVVVGYQFHDSTVFKEALYHGIPVRIPYLDGEISYVRAVYLKITSYRIKNMPPGQPENMPPNTVALVRRRHRVSDPIKLDSVKCNRTHVYVNITQIPIRTAEILTPYAIQGSQFSHYTIHDFDAISFYQVISRGKYGLRSIRLEKKVTREFADKVPRSQSRVHEEITRLCPLHEKTTEKYLWCA